MNGNIIPFQIFQKFQNYPYSHFCIVYIDDILIFSQVMAQYWKHLPTFENITEKNGLVVSAR